MKDIWEKSYESMRTMGLESVSGTGSSLDATKAIIRQLPGLLKQFGIKSMLDIPCGDGNWMSRIDLTGVSYWGADIVAENIRHNIAQYPMRNPATWMVLDITTDVLPAVDLIFCRDCLVHFSEEDVWRALVNICNSGSKYLLTTTFVGRGKNDEIHTTGWQALDLEAAPYYLPKPLFVLNEECPEGDGIWKNKSLALWEVQTVCCRS